MSAMDQLLPVPRIFAKTRPPGPCNFLENTLYIFVLSESPTTQDVPPPD
jgi:hypothetical protein